MGQAKCLWGYKSYTIIIIIIIILLLLLLLLGDLIFAIYLRTMSEASDPRFQENETRKEVYSKYKLFWSENKNLVTKEKK